MTNHQRTRQRRFFTGLAMAVLVITAYIGLLGFAGGITAEQPATTITHSSR
jgi:hypothetical protein